MRELLQALRDALADPDLEQELTERLSDAADGDPVVLPTLQAVERALEDCP